MKIILIYLPILIFFAAFPHTNIITAALIFTIYPAFLPPTRKISHQQLFQSSARSRTITAIIFIIIFLSPVINGQNHRLQELLIMLFVIALPEEYFFRYIYFQSAQKTKAGPTRQIITDCLKNGAIFMAFHIITRPGILSALTLFPGILLALVYRKTNDFMLCCALHTGMNLLFLDFLQKKLIFLLPA